MVWAWGRSTGLTACALVSRRCALWGWREGVPGGAALRHCEGSLGSGALRPRLPVLRAGCRGPLLTCCGRGCAGVGAQHCPFGLYLLQGAGCRGGGARPSRGGWPSTVVRGVLWGGQPGFRNPCFPGAVGVSGVGTQHRPHSVHSCEPSLRAVGSAGGRPRGGALRRCEGRLSSGALCPPGRPSSGRTIRVCYPHAVGAGVRALGAQHRPFGLHALWGAACRGAGGRPSKGGWPSTIVRGDWCQALPLPRPPVPWSGQPGFRVSRARLVWAWGPSTGPTACALASRCCALWGLREGVPQGAPLRCCEERLSSGALPPLAARFQAGLLGSATNMLWAQVCGPGGPALSLWLACPEGGCVPRGWREAVSEGMAFHRCEGCLVSGAVPLPSRPSIGAGSQGSATRVSRARLVCAWGPSTGPTACACASRRCALRGLREGVPGGGALRRCWGRLSSGAPPPPAARP